MKTLRHNTFETNSSSTHAYTVSSVDLKNPVNLNIIPDNDGLIRIGKRAIGDRTNPQDKIAHMLEYAYLVGNQDLFDRIHTVVADHTGGKLYVEGRVWDRDKWVVISPITKVSDEPVNIAPLIDDDYEGDDDEDDSLEGLRDAFYSLTCEYGHGSVQQFVEDMESIASSNESLRVFFFSSRQGVHIESYYN